MKRFTVSLLALTLVLSLTACTPASDKPTTSATPTPTPTTSESLIPTTPSPTPEVEDPAITAKRAEALAEADKLTLGYYYDEALALLSDPTIANDEVTAKTAEIQAVVDSLVPYTGTVKHIFFHSLIVYPERIFRDKTTPMGGYNAGFSTKAEFEKMLPQLYERGYVLYDLNECFEKIDGKMVRKEILLPPGKEPLVLSVDDVAYQYGSAYALKLVLKEDGSIVNLVKNDAGELVEMADGDVYGVLERFLQDHPDFSYRGHRGTFAMTGFQGAFGYDIDVPEGQQKVLELSTALRQNGWNFASHSYTHNRKGYFGPGTEAGKIQWDTNRWVNEIEPYLGDTNLFIAPYGFLLKQPYLQIVLDAGFDIYCTVDDEFINETYDDYALMSRIEIGGYSMSHFQDLLNENFFNVDEVFDAAGRPPVIG